LERIGPGYHLVDMIAPNAFECLQIEPHSCRRYPDQNHLSFAQRTATAFNPADGVLSRDMVVHRQYSARFLSWANHLLWKVALERPKDRNPASAGRLVNFARFAILCATSRRSGVAAGAQDPTFKDLG
jgi:hypothetical protein